MTIAVLRSAIVIAALSGLSACATPDKAGVRNPEFFAKVATKTVIDSARPQSDVRACFEEIAILLPGSAFKSVAGADASLYRLRAFGYTFEEAQFVASPAGGSTITFMVAPNLNSRWMVDMERNRLLPLRACAAGEAGR